MAKCISHNQKHWKSRGPIRLSITNNIKTLKRWKNKREGISHNNIRTSTKIKDGKEVINSSRLGAITTTIKEVASTQWATKHHSTTRVKLNSKTNNLAGEAATEVNNSNRREDTKAKVEDTINRELLVAAIITTTTPIIMVITMVVISNSSENSHYKQHGKQNKRNKEKV